MGDRRKYFQKAVSAIPECNNTEQSNVNYDSIHYSEKEKCVGQQ